ncbi:MAG: hypothetical protein RL693_1849 [Verrucomicrobiota bacterium]|jgi:ferric-dicitrate binding protein FerR (iron transport regulator)
MSMDHQKEQWHLLELCERALDNNINDSEREALNSLLEKDEAARALFAKALHQHAELRFDERLCRELAESPEPVEFKPVRRNASFLMAVAACAVIAGVAAFLVMQQWAPAKDASHSKAIATVVKSSHCKWAGSTLPTAEGSRVSAGVLELVEGLATLRFDSGAEVVLEAPATIELIDAMNCRLRRGTLVADVPPSAIGFSVDTQDAKVVDYGTRFGVSTGEDGKYMVQVLEGLVEVNHKGEQEIKQLRAGQSVDRGLMKTKVNPTSPDPEPNRWQPDSILNAGDGWRIISTAFGQGKDSYIQSNDKSKNFGQDSYFRVKWSSVQPDLNRKGYLGFDISKFKNGKITEAELVLSIEPSDLGFATLVPDSKFAVYGLIDESQDSWDENGLSWHEAPAHDPAQIEKHLPMPGKSVLLGHFEIAQGISRGTRSLRGQALANFINQDTNGMATFIICRETDETAKGGLVHAFATKESGSNTPPLLRLKGEE